MNSVNSSSSEVGEVVDVATPSRKKPLAWGVLMIGVGAAWLVGAAFAFHEGGTGATIGGTILGLLAYFCFAYALFRFRIAARTDWYLRAGRGGLSIHVPTFALANFVGGCGTIRRDMRWSDVKNWGPMPEKVLV